MDVVRLATSFSEYTLYLKCKSRYIWIFDDTIVLFCCKEFYKSGFVFFKWMRPRKKYLLNQESKRIVGKNACDFKGKYLLNQENKRIVGKNRCDFK